MENASKALIIAAGVLFALILLAAFIYLFSEMSFFTEEKDKQEFIEQLEKFNKEYESYQRNLLRGVDIASVSNKANSFNEKNEKQDINEEINVYITLISQWNGYAPNIKHKTTGADGIDWTQLRNNNKDEFYVFKTKYFKCDKIDYNADTGKVETLYFTEIDISDKFE